MSEKDALEVLLVRMHKYLKQIPGWTTDYLDIGGQRVFPISSISEGFSSNLLFYVIAWNDARTEAWSIPIEIGRFFNLSEEQLGIIVILASRRVLDSAYPDRRPVSFNGGDMGRADHNWRFGL